MYLHRVVLKRSTQIRNYGDVSPIVGWTPSSARDAAVPMKNASPKPAGGPAAVQGDRPTWQKLAPDSLPYLRRGALRACSVAGLLNACLAAGLFGLVQPASADVFTLILQGKVVMEDGSPPPKTVGIERICSDENQGSAPGPITNKKGEFVWNMVMDRGSTRVCKIHAVLPGYTSTQFDVTGSFITENIHNANSTVTIPPLTLVANVHDPKVIVISDAGVPSKSLKPWKAAMKALEAKDYAGADRELQEALELSPKFASGWNTLGLVYGNEKKLAESRDAFQHAIESDPKLLAPYVSLDRLCIRMKDWQCAVKDTDELLAADVKKLYTAEALMHQAVARLELKDLPGAESSIQESLRLDPTHKNPRAEYVLGRVLEAKGDFSGASEHMLKYLELAPTAADSDQIRAHMQIMGTPAAASAGQPDLELP